MARKKLPGLKVEDLRPHLGEPLAKVAVIFHRSLAQIKLDLRKIGISRWPCSVTIFSYELDRKIKALHAKKKAAENDICKATSENEKITLVRVITSIKKQMLRIEQDPHFCTRGIDVKSCYEQENSSQLFKMKLAFVLN